MNDMSRRGLFRAAGVLGVAGLAAGCSKAVTGSARPIPNPTPIAPPDALALLRRKGTVTVLTLAQNKPFSYGDSSGVTGEAVEVVKSVFTALGVPRVNFEMTEYAAALQKMAAAAAAGDDQFALFAGGTIADAQQCAAFSPVPDCQYLTAFAVKQGNPKHIVSIADVVRLKAKVVAVAGPLTDRLTGDTHIPASLIQPVPDPVLAVRMVAEGQADCFPFYDISLRQMAEGGAASGVTITDGFTVSDLDPMVASFMFPKQQSDTSIQDAFADQLNRMRISGEWLTTASRFGLTEANALADGFTPEGLCR